MSAAGSIRALRAVALLACATVLGAVSAAHAGDADPRLGEARKLLEGPQEGTVRKGAHLCLEMNTAAAMELLLDVLDRDHPHRRDIVWEVIPSFTDPYARERVAAEMRKNRKNHRVRQWCAQALGLYGDAGFVGQLDKSLNDPRPFVQAAAAQALGRLRDPGPVEHLKRLAGDTDPFVREAVFEALVRIDPAAHAAWLEKGLADADAGVRCALLGVVPELRPAETEERSRAALADPDWRPRLQAVDNLVAARTKTAVDALVGATGDARPVVAQRATAFLQRISGKLFTLREQWEGWWRESREAFAFPEGDAAAPPPEAGHTRAAFNGLDVTSDHVAFVIDASADMRLSTKAGKVKSVRAREELDRTLTPLHGLLVFDVVTYGAELRTMAKAPVPLDEKSHKAALQFVDDAKLEGRKDIWAVLEAVVSDPDIDTVYLLSSGEPEVGLYVHWNRVTEHLRELNRFHKVVVHTVAYSNSTWYRDQMQKIAEATGGKFTFEE